jgi:hypothetical protein
MNKLLVKGRHLGHNQFDSKNIVVDFAVHEDNVTLRLDDKEHLDWWLEINIPLLKLWQLIEEADKIREDRHMGDN